jgi:hypothetical protein
MTESTNDFRPDDMPGVSGHRLLVAHVGTNVTPKPRPSDTAKMKRVRRLKPSMEMTLMPETHTEANRNVVMPPSTQLGMVVTHAPTLASTPKQNSQMPQEMPAHREAQRVRAMTPLFCAKVVEGRVCAMAPKKLLHPAVATERIYILPVNRTLSRLRTVSAQARTRCCAHSGQLQFRRSTPPPREPYKTC